MGKANIVTLIVAVTLLGACSGHEPLTTRLDEMTGVTVVSMDTPIVLARPTRLAIAARDYAYLGPIEINRNGDREHYLWLGLASTIDRALVSDPPAQATTLALLVDGLPMNLPLTPWDEELEEQPYGGNSPVYASLSARASLDQIARIAKAESVTVHINTDAGDSFNYRLWEGEWPTWAPFSARTP